ncbi:MAG TPA: hypothetical protein VFA18_03075 [Gemmataceae bacterium]|nr:hypothetical protein [Gemmataceae bacterium]
MAQVCWQGTLAGRYHIDVALGGFRTPLMIDLGLVDSAQQVGFSIQPALYDKLKQAGALGLLQTFSRMDASGQISQTESGLVSAQLLDPATGRPVGPAVQLYVLRGNPGVPDRVGVVFFHRLPGCRVLWALGTRTWCIEYP